MRSDLTCPVEIERVKVDKDAEKTGQIVCNIGFLNLSGREIDSVQMNIICFDAQDNRLGGRLVRASVKPEEGERRCGGLFLPEHVDETAHVEASVEKVWFKDGVVWRREERNVREYTPNALPDGREKDRLRSVAGPDAVGYAREGDGLWMCVCGRANAIDEKTCMKCGRERDKTLADYSYQTIESTVGRRERDLEKQTMDNLRRSSEQTVAEQQAAQKKRDKRRRRVRLAVALLALAAAGLAAARWGVPFAATYYGQTRYDKGLYADAETVFAWVDAYWPDEFGAAQMAVQSRVRIVEGLIDAGTQPALLEAQTRAKALASQEGDALYDRATLALAALYEQSGDMDEAEAIYRAMPQNEEAASRLLALIYTVADAAQERLDYPTAIERFASLGDYEDADERRETCVYLYGRQLLREGHYAEAAEQFLLVSGVEDAIELTRQSYYALAGERREAGEPEEAAELYERLGVYREAEAYAKACRYEAGMAALEAGELERATGQLELAGDYEDARLRFEEIASTLGARAMTEGNAQEAVNWYARLTPTEASLEVLHEAMYALAQEQEQAGRLTQAAQTYASLGEYQDASERADALEYEMALAQIETEPGEALVRFELLGDYEDAPEQATRCRYLVAQQALEAQEYERALSLFEALGDYEDSARCARRCRYQLGGQAREAGRYDEAAALYEACGAYLDAEELAQRSRYESADALDQAGEYAAAASAFAALGSYDDAPARVTRAEDAWLGGAHADALMGMELGDYAGVIAALEDVWQETLPERYADIPELYTQACLARADELIAQNKPLDALDPLERIADDAQAKKRLDAYVYDVIGTWVTASGARYIFRRDGTCSLDGREAYFGGSGYSIFIGDEPYPTRRVYNVANLRGKTLTLRENETGATLRMTYAGEPLDLVEETGEQPDGSGGEDAGGPEGEGE